MLIAHQKSMLEKLDIAPQAPKFFHLIIQKYDRQHLTFYIKVLQGL